MEDECAPVHGALRRVLLVSRVFGLAPLSFKRRHTVSVVRVWNAQVYYGYLLCSTLNTINILAIIVYVLAASNWIYKDSTVGMLLVLISTVSAAAVMSVACYGGRKRMKYLLLMLQQLNKITILIPNETNFVKNRKQTRAISVMMLLLVSSFILNYGLTTGYISTYVNLPPKEMACMLVFFGAFHAQQALIAILEVQIILVMHTIQRAVESFNSELKRMLDAIAKGNKPSEVMRPKLNECLWRIGRYYLILCENIRRMNSQDGALLLLLLGYLIVQLMEKSYRLVLGLSSATNNLNGWNYYLNNTLRIYMAMVNVVLVGALLNACNKIQLEIKKLRVLVSEVMYRGRRTGEAVSTAAEMLCEQVLLHQPTFKPLCVCGFTRSLFITVITGVVTYLVTVMKFYYQEKGLKTEKP